jgi:MFS family permease
VLPYQNRFTERDSYEDPNKIMASEETPLIDHGRDHPPNQHPNRHHRARVLITTILCLTIMDWASYLSSAPQLDIVEGIICDKIYGNGNSTALDAPSVISRDCTADVVQSELALVTQIMTAATEFPSIFLAIPYGALADRVGRRPVLFMSLIGLLAQDVLVRCIVWWPSVIPLRLLWLTPLTTLLGGGSSVALAVMYLAVADVVEEHERATWFSRMVVSVLVAEIAAAPAASALMRWHGPWFPFLMSTVVFALSIPLVMLFPETSRAVTAQDDRSDRPESPKTIDERFTTAIRRTSQSLGLILKDRNIVLILVSYFASATAQNSSLHIQFMRQRFKWEFSSVRFSPE